MASPAPHNKARRQSFTQYVLSSVTALLPSTVAAQTARDETKATSWERLVHCCTALGYALALSGVVVVLVTWLSTWDWVRRDDDGVPGVNNDALVLLLGGVMSSAHALSTYCNIAHSPERPDDRSGPRYARWVLAVGAVMVPVGGYGWLWALEHGARINAWYSLLHPPSLLVWAILFLIMELGGRQKWAEHDRRKRQEEHGEEGGGAEGAGGGAQLVKVAAQSAGSPEAQQSSSWIADTLINLIVLFAVLSVATLCKCC